MDIISLSDAAQIKKEISDRFGVDLHFCDSCGGQSFAMDKTSDEIKEYITQFWDSRNMSARFSEDGLRFTVRGK
ncbi:MAG: hypothetical protein J1E39_02425 [Eubacterium sp.]|nr:hypothetical protein [Eubacterium sp.]